MWAEAVRHALAAQDLELAAGWIEQSWPDMDGSFRVAAWLDWAKSLPEELVRTRPVLSAGYGWAWLESGQLQAAQAHLDNAESWLHATGAHPAARPDGMAVADEAQFQALPASIATARAYLAQAAGDVPATICHGRQALDLIPGTDYLQRGIVAALLGLAYWAHGDLELARQTLAGGMADMQTAGNILYAIRGTYSLADICLAQGRLQEAIAVYEQSLQLATQHGDQVLRGTADLYLRLSELYYEQNNPGAAGQYLAKGEQLGEHTVSPHWQYRRRLALARAHQAQGNLEATLDLLEEAQRLYVPTPVPDLAPIAAMQARLWIAQGRLTPAQDWANQQGLSAGDELSYRREFEHITLARLLLARYRDAGRPGDLQEAGELLARLLNAAEAGRRWGSLIEILILQALAYQARGDDSLALPPLQRALALAAPQGYVRLFVDEGPPVARMLAEAARLETEPGYVHTLLAAFESAPAEESAPQAAPAGRLVEPLSQRELEILRLIAQGLSNRQIGARLFLALPTVKGHNRNIFGKLQAQNRTEAIARARQLGLL
ncbi:MAG: hypothetical protein GYA17_03735 [Chloroflexi bacterium]|nr:hypothetical protein [Chloroflexota bacterium]